MTADEKLAAILAAVQVDPGNRGLAELFAACPGDFAAACRNIADHSQPRIIVVTGFIISSVEPPTFETDGPLGAVFLLRAFAYLGSASSSGTEYPCHRAIRAGLAAAGTYQSEIVTKPPHDDSLFGDSIVPSGAKLGFFTHTIMLERPGPAGNGRYHTMRGSDITELMLPAHHLCKANQDGEKSWQTIGIGDGGNEIGMGKLPHDLVARTIPNGDLIHCRVPTDHLIVAGVSNWGAYALAAGVYVLRGVTPPDDLFDPDREREILELMVREGPLVDGVTGKQTATVDGLSWDDYVRPLVRIRDILKA